MANQLIYNNNKKRYTYISVLSFKTFDRLCFSIYQLYFSTCRLAHLSCLYFCRSRSRSGDAAKGHHLSDNLRTTLTHPTPAPLPPTRGFAPGPQWGLYIVYNIYIRYIYIYFSLPLYSIKHAYAGLWSHMSIKITFAILIVIGFS